MRKTLSAFLIMICMCLCMFGQTDTVWAASGSVSVSVSSQTVNIGDTVTVTAKASGPSGEKAVATMTVSYDSSIVQFVSCSTTYGGGGNSVTATADIFTVTLKAISAGTSAVSLSGSDGVVFDTNEELDSMSGGSTSVTVNNAVSGDTGTGTGTGSGTGTGTGAGTGTGTGSGTGSGTGTGAGTGTGSGTNTPKLSDDNSLRVLKISPGTLSPEFSGSRTKYTATVANDVTNIAVTATPVNKKAVVESVTGNTNLVIGSNTISIVVRAENGVTATYKIEVTRKAAAEQPSSQQPEEESTEQDTTEPEGTTEQGTTELEEDEKIVKLYHGTNYVIALALPGDIVLPDTYIETSVLLENGDSFSAYREEGGEDEAGAFFLFYGVNQEGAESWYRYDSGEGTYQRTTLNFDEEDTSVDENMAYLQNEYNALAERYNEEKTFSRNTISILIFVIAVLVIIIINLLLRGRGRKKEFYDDDDDFTDGEVIDFNDF